jgi:DNA-directed RNA polymerase specialized sigma24 family protein
MQLTQTFATSDIRPLLQGDRADLEAAFTEINSHLRNWFIHKVRLRLPGLLSPEDLADAWQETLRELFKAVRTGRFDPHRELYPWLWIDNARRNASYANLMQRVQGEMSPIDESFPAVVDEEEERSLLIERMNQVIRDLPVRQQTVLRVFLDQFPTTLDKETLRERVSEASGREESPAAIRRAFQEARRKIGVALGTG